MVEKTPRADAILVHGYWMSEHRTGLALRNRLAVRAAALEYDNGKGAETIVIDLAHLWGNNHPSGGKLMVQELTSRYNVPREAIICRERAYSTYGEVQAALEIAEQNKWNNVIDLAFKKHHLTIPWLYRNTSLSVEYQSVEDVLKEKDPNPHIKRLVERLSHSPYEFIYLLYEGLKWTRMHLPRFNYETLEEKNKKARTQKGREFIVPFDVYKL